jgi:hypothetical protein
MLLQPHSIKLKRPEQVPTPKSVDKRAIWCNDSLPMKCRYVFPDGKRCENDSQSGYCLGHPPGGGGPTAAWVSSISAAISAATAAINYAWPHLAPVIQTWLQNHAGFMARSENLLQAVINAGDDPAVDISIQKRIDDLVEEAAELCRAVYRARIAVYEAKILVKAEEADVEETMGAVVKASAKMQQSG